MTKGRTFKEVLNEKDFVVTCEVGPPKGVSLEKMTEHIDLLKEKVDAINFTDNQSSVMRYPSLGGAIICQERGGEPILQVTCRDRNRLALQSDLLFAYSRGIRNVLCLTGDSIPMGDHKGAKSVFDIDSVHLIRTIKTLEDGKDLAGNDLEGSPSFFCGAIVTPEANPIGPQMMKFEKKVDAGAQFFQTQAIFDLDKFCRFMEDARRLQVKILAGILLLVSAGMARYLNNSVPGISVPGALVEEMACAPKGKGLDKGVEIAARTIRTLKEKAICDGVHIMAIGREEIVPEILSASGII